MHSGEAQQADGQRVEKEKRRCANVPFLLYLRVVLFWPVS